MKKIRNLTIVFALVAALLAIPSAVMAAERTGQEPYTGTATGAQIAAAILTPQTAPYLVSASTTGNQSQLQVYTSSLQGFPTDGSSWGLITTGQGSGIGGVATTFVSVNTGGPSQAAWCCHGQTGYDIVTVDLTLAVPSSVTSNLSFDWVFGTEENPTYTHTMMDTAYAIVTTSAGSQNILLLPGPLCVDTSNAAAYSNAPGGSSTTPTAPFPSPDDTVYNAVTSAMGSASMDVSAYQGENITISFQIGDGGDANLDSGLFIDNLRFEELPVEIDIKPWSDPNSVNRNKKGVMAIAILGSDIFDPTALDPNMMSFTLCGVSVEPAHDITDPLVFLDHIVDVWYHPGPNGIYFDFDDYGDVTANMDLIPDLVVHFSVPDLSISGSKGDIVPCELVVIYNGLTFIGSDDIRIVK